MQEKPVRKSLEVMTVKSKKNQGPKALDTLQDATFKAIAEAHLMNLTEDLDRKKDQIEAIEISQAMKDWAGKLENSSKRKKKRSRFTSSKAAIFLLVLLGGFAITTLSVEAQRYKLFEYVVEMKETAMRVYRTDEMTQFQDPLFEFDTYDYPTLLPKGYTLKEYSKDYDIVNMIFTKGEERIIFYQFDTAGDFTFNTEGAVVKEVMVGEYSGFLITNGKKNQLYWQNDEKEYTVRGTITEKEIMRFAESLKRTEKRN